MERDVVWGSWILPWPIRHGVICGGIAYDAAGVKYRGERGLVRRLGPEERGHLLRVKAGSPDLPISFAQSEPASTHHECPCYTF
jgi:hypothetical protein